MQIIETTAQRAATARLIAEAQDHAAFHASGCGTDPGPDPFPPLEPCDEPQDNGHRMLGILLLALFVLAVALIVYAVGRAR